MGLKNIGQARKSLPYTTQQIEITLYRPTLAVVVEAVRLFFVFVEEMFYIVSVGYYKAVGGNRRANGDWKPQGDCIFAKNGLFGFQNSVQRGTMARFPPVISRIPIVGSSCIVGTYRVGYSLRTCLPFVVLLIVLRFLLVHHYFILWPIWYFWQSAQR